MANEKRDEKSEKCCRAPKLAMFPAPRLMLAEIIPNAFYGAPQGSLCIKS